MFEIDKIILDHPTCSNCAHMTTDSNCEPLCKMMENGQKIEYPENSKLVYFSACNLWQESDSRKKLLQNLPFEIEGDELVAVKEEFENIEEVIVPFGIKKICSDAFNTCIKLKRIFIPESVVKIETSAFSDCTSLREIQLPDSIETIEYGAFHHCTSLEKINIPANLNQIEGLVFSDCFALKTVLFSKESKLETIKKEAFMNCNRLESIKFPQSLKKVEKWAFRWCDPLPEGTLAFPEGCDVDEDIFDPE